MRSAGIARTEGRRSQRRCDTKSASWTRLCAAFSSAIGMFSSGASFEHSLSSLINVSMPSWMTAAAYILLSCRALLRASRLPQWFRQAPGDQLLMYFCASSSALPHAAASPLASAALAVASASLNCLD